MHGQSRTPEYNCWKAMKSRCYNVNHYAYSRYGGKGVIVCKRWIDSPVKFISDMGRKPGKEYSIDRLDNNGDYTPDNCRWATAQEQTDNRVNTRKITLNGLTKTYTEWSKIYNIKWCTLYARIERGWNPLSALTTPPRRY